MCTQYLSPVLHLLFPICQPLASLLLLSQRFLGLSTEIDIIDDFADLSASFRGALTICDLLACILLPTLLVNGNIQ